MQTRVERALQFLIRQKSLLTEDEEEKDQHEEGGTAE